MASFVFLTYHCHVVKFSVRSLTKTYSKGLTLFWSQNLNQVRVTSACQRRSLNKSSSPCSSCLSMMKVHGEKMQFGLFIRVFPLIPTFAKGHVLTSKGQPSALKGCYWWQMTVNWVTSKFWSKRESKICTFLYSTPICWCSFVS